MAILQQSACLVVNLILVSRFVCTTASQALIKLDDDPDPNLTSVGWCLMLVFG